MASAGTASAHARPQTTAPQPNARMDTPPAHIVITYDDGIDPSGSSLLLLDATGITDVRVDTYCKRQAIRDKFKGQIDEKTFN